MKSMQDLRCLFSDNDEMRITGYGVILKKRGIVLDEVMGTLQDSQGRNIFRLRGEGENGTDKAARFLLDIPMYPDGEIAELFRKSENEDDWRLDADGWIHLTKNKAPDKAPNKDKSLLLLEIYMAIRSPDPQPAIERILSSCSSADIEELFTSYSSWEPILADFSFLWHLPLGIATILEKHGKKFEPIIARIYNLSDLSALEKAKHYGKVQCPQVAMALLKACDQPVPEIIEDKLKYPSQEEINTKILATLSSLLNKMDNIENVVTSMETRLKTLESKVIFSKS